MPGEATGGRGVGEGDPESPEGVKGMSYVCVKEMSRGCHRCVKEMSGGCQGGVIGVSRRCQRGMACNVWYVMNGM